MLTVSLVEDDDGYRELLCSYISRGHELRLGSAYATGEEALRRFPCEKPDVALVDIQLPGLDGIECVRGLRQIVPPLATHFIIVTGSEDPHLIFDSLRAGAHGYLLKDKTSSESLVAAIKDVAAGGGPMTSAVARKVIVSFENRHARQPDLSKREMEVLQCIVRGLLYKQISDELGISMSTVRTHLLSIYNKLHVHSRTEAAVQFLRQQENGTHSGDSAAKL
jgi:DNA-binding NarL/FixJ family response regulator